MGTHLAFISRLHPRCCRGLPSAWVWERRISSAELQTTSFFTAWRKRLYTVDYMNQQQAANSNNGRMLYGGLCEKGVDLPFLRKESGEGMESTPKSLRTEW
jgi:hypothetical protein